MIPATGGLEVSGPRRRSKMEAEPLNARLKRKLADLGKALSEAIAESSAASRHLADLREEGYSVYLLLESDGERGSGHGGGALAARPRGDRGHAARQLAGQRQLTGRSQSPSDRRLAASSAVPEPDFLIDGRDLAFLRSVGIDPTRSPRRKKGSG